MSEALRIAIAGAGRMGRAIETLIHAEPALAHVGTWQRGGDLDALAADADVVIDFSLPDATRDVLAVATGHGVPLVCGVSGLDDGQLTALDQAAHSIAIVYDRNMSQGVAVLTEAVRQVAGALGPEFVPRIEETHHVHKKDAPSGTALMLAEALADARDVDLGAIDIHSERRGEVPGDHTVTFTTANERLTLSHSVTTRDVFAAGAIAAARWVVGRGPGRYTMRDVLVGG